MKYTARDLEYIAEATKSQKLSQEAMAAINHLTKLKHQIAEQSRVIAYREILIRQFKLQLQDSNSKSSCTDTSSDGEATEIKVHKLHEQHSELESKYVARYAAYKKEVARSRALATQLALANAVVAEQDQRIQELETAASMRAAEMGLLQSTINELVSTEELEDTEQQLEAEQEISRDRDAQISQLDALSAKHRKHVMSLQTAVDRRKVATKDLKSRIHSLRTDFERSKCCTCHQ
ncbi:hypothetical protein GQ54DRAFT_300425 [Martensiomyces pterosporus]|nr:hypothetical protein GQ54DRAFT_300425 [Martensiomyces pterosporus]